MSKEDPVYAYIEYEDTKESERSMKSLAQRRVFNMSEPLELSWRAKTAVAGGGKCSSASSAAVSSPVVSSSSSPSSSAVVVDEGLSLDDGELRTLHVGNITANVTRVSLILHLTLSHQLTPIFSLPLLWFFFNQRDLEKLFGQFGVLKRVNVIQRPKDNRTFGFVTFQSADAARRAFNSIRESTTCHFGMPEPLKVDFSKIEQQKRRQLSSSSGGDLPSSVNHRMSWRGGDYPDSYEGSSVSLVAATPSSCNGGMYADELGSNNNVNNTSNTAATSVSSRRVSSLITGRNRTILLVPQLSERNACPDSEDDSVIKARLEKAFSIYGKVECVHIITRVTPSVVVVMDQDEVPEETILSPATSTSSSSSTVWLGEGNRRVIVPERFALVVYEYADDATRAAAAAVSGISASSPAAMYDACFPRQRKVHLTWIPVSVSVAQVEAWLAKYGGGEVRRCDKKTMVLAPCSSSSSSSTTSSTTTTSSSAAADQELSAGYETVDGYYRLHIEFARAESAVKALAAVAANPHAFSSQHKLHAEYSQSIRRLEGGVVGVGANSRFIPSSSSSSSSSFSASLGSSVGAGNRRHSTSVVVMPDRRQTATPTSTHSDDNNDGINTITTNNTSSLPLSTGDDDHIKGGLMNSIDLAREADEEFVHLQDLINEQIDTQVVELSDLLLEEDGDGLNVDTVEVGLEHLCF